MSGELGFECAPVGLVLLDQHRCVLRTNREARQLLPLLEGFEGMPFPNVFESSRRAEAELLLLGSDTNRSRRSCIGSVEVVVRAEGRGFVVCLQELKPQPLWAAPSFRSLLDSAPVAVAVFDRTLRCRAASRRWLRAFGPASVPSELPVPHALLQGALGGQSQSLELPWGGRTGGVEWLEVKVVPWRGAGGEVVGVIATSDDITKHRQLEQRLRHGEKMEALGRFVGEVSHEFSNVLCGVLGLTQLAMERLPPESSAYQDLSRVMDCALLASELTRRLLGFSRRHESEPRPWVWDHAVREALPLLSQLTPDNVVLESELAAGTAAVKADPSFMTTVLLNLATNARDAMPRGGVLSIRTRATELEEADLLGAERSQPGVYLELEVADTGHGMSPQVVLKSCEPFFTTKDSGRGTGLGLATVSALVELHSGLLRLDSAPGCGTRVRILLPRLKAEEIGEPAASSVSPREQLAPLFALDSHVGSGVALAQEAG